MVDFPASHVCSLEGTVSSYPVKPNHLPFISINVPIIGITQLHCIITSTPSELDLDQEPTSIEGLFCEEPEVSHHSSDDRDDSCVIAVLPLWILWLSIVSGCDGSDGYSYIVIAVL